MNMLSRIETYWRTPPESLEKPVQSTAEGVDRHWNGLPTHSVEICVALARLTTSRPR